MSIYFDFDEVDAFTVGALGEPGARLFLLQARRGATSVTIKCEKRQAGAIADYLRRVLVDLPDPSEKPAAAALELEMPAEAAFVLGPVGLGYDRENDRLLVQLEELVETDIESDPTEAEDDGTDPAERLKRLADDVDRGHVRLFLSRSQAAAFCDHADSVVAAGRPPCRWCGHPINPNGHACPRMN